MGLRLFRILCATRRSTELSLGWIISSAATTSEEVRIDYSSVAIVCRRCIRAMCEDRLPLKQSRRGSATWRRQRNPQPCSSVGSFFPRLDFTGSTRRAASLQMSGVSGTISSFRASRSHADRDIYHEQVAEPDHWSQRREAYRCAEKSRVVQRRRIGVAQFHRSASSSHACCNVSFLEIRSETSRHRTAYNRPSRSCSSTDQCTDVLCRSGIFAV